MHRTLFTRLQSATMAALLGLVAVTSAHAQDRYPAKPIRLVVPFPAGTAPDVMARYWGDRVSKQLQQPVIVENRAGASTIVGTQAAVASPADGYTLLYTASGTVTINPFAYKKLPYQPQDLVPVTRMLSIPLVVSVPTQSPYKTLADLIKAAKSTPGQVSYASYGMGTVPHMSMAYFANSAGLTLNHIPYRDGGLTDLIGGRVDVAFSPIADVLPYIKAGRSGPWPFPVPAGSTRWPRCRPWRRPFRVSKATRGTASLRSRERRNPWSTSSPRCRAASRSRTSTGSTWASSAWFR